LSYIQPGAVMVVDLQLPVQSVSITTTVVSSNLVRGEVYSIQHYAIKFVWFATGRWISLSTRFTPPIKLTVTIYNWNIVESDIKHHKPTNRSWRVVSSTPLYDKVCQWLATNKTDRHDVTEILLKVALNTINQPPIDSTYIPDIVFWYIPWHCFILLLVTIVIFYDRCLV
jgi:hypothetical protein